MTRFHATSKLEREVAELARKYRDAYEGRASAEQIIWQMDRGKLETLLP